MRVDDFAFDLPDELIAQEPMRPRERARLLLIGQELHDYRIADLPDLLQPGDLLVLNDTRVLPTRFYGLRGNDGVEITLVNAADDKRWWALGRPANRLRIGEHIDLAPGLEARVLERAADGRLLMALAAEDNDTLAAIKRHGVMPLPPYIRRPRGGSVKDLVDYQPVFARRDGSVASPTASLHFSPELLRELEERDIGHAFLTLHVGLGTFLPVRAEDTDSHVMHAEWYEVPEATAGIIEAARAEGRRIVAIGSTVLRALEAVGAEHEAIVPTSGQTALFITPGYRFKVVDLMITNFHLPRSTLLMLVAAFAGLDRIKEAYAHAVDQRYRFYSYGDACLIERNPNA